MKRMQAKKILMLLANGFDPDPRVHNQARSLVKAGYHVTILCWDRECKHPKREIIDGILVERFGIRSSYGRGSWQIGYLLKFWLRAYKSALNLSPDVIHAHDFNTLPLGYFLAKLKHIRIIFDAHENYSEMLADNVHPLLKRGVKKAEAFLVRRVDALITVGYLLEKHYARLGARVTRVVGNWKSLEQYSYADSDIEMIRKGIGIQDDKLIICYFGYFEPGRGLLELINAVSGEAKIALLIGGKGVLTREIVQTCKNLKNVYYFGYVAPEAIPRLTAISDVVYYGLENGCGNNGFSTPNKLFEALAAGKAVLTGNYGEIAKIVKEEDCGITLENINKQSLVATFRKLCDQNLLWKYKKNSKLAGIEKYNWENAEMVLIDIYDNLIQKKYNCQ